MPNFRKGTAALQEAQAKAAASRSGSFSPFAPFISWGDDGDEQYLLFLNQWEDMPLVDYIGFIPQTGEKRDGTKYTYNESVIARTDPAIGENSDPMVETKGAKPVPRHIAVAAVLEPTFTEVKNRKRATGFAVKTESYERRVRDAEGNLTDDTEEVTTPVFGFVVQSPHNFFNVIQSYDAGEAPVHETAVKITRAGAKGSNSTSYLVTGYPDTDVDLTALIENVEGMSYLGDTLKDVQDAIEGMEPLEAANFVGNALLDKRLDDLCDEERYNRILRGIPESVETLDRWGGGKKGEAKPARKSQRKAPTAEDAGVAGTDAAEEHEGVEADDEDDPKAKLARLRESAKKRRAGAAA